MARSKTRLRTSPHFLIIGAQKCGTTSLFNYLIQHPDISPPIRKELHFFDRRYDKGMHFYFAHFPTLLEREQKKITGESTPKYICHPRVRERVFKHMPDVKLIALLRNPVDRAYSNYQQLLRKGRITCTFEEAIKQDVRKIITRSIYAAQLKAWLNLFSKDQILVLESERFFNQPEETVKEVLLFLDLAYYELKVDEIYNQNLNKDKMDPETRASLVSFFMPHNKKLFKLLGETFDWDK